MVPVGLSARKFVNDEKLSPTNLISTLAPDDCQEMRFVCFRSPGSKLLVRGRWLMKTLHRHQVPFHQKRSPDRAIRTIYQESRSRPSSRRRVRLIFHRRRSRWNCRQAYGWPLNAGVWQETLSSIVASRSRISGSGLQAERKWLMAPLQREEEQSSPHALRCESTFQCSLRSVADKRWKASSAIRSKVVSKIVFEGLSAASR